MQSGISKVDRYRFLLIFGVVFLARSFYPAWQTPIYDDHRADSTNLIPILAYYYIWFDVRSWERAKTDYPLLGRYSSDDLEVMRSHVEWAKAAGIDGFIVSWKSTDKLNPRLEQLIQVAEQMDFKLAVIYEGLDFYRDPLPVEKVRDDVDYFIANYSESPVFDLFEKPLIIWSGSWEFTREEIQSVTQNRRNQLLILASEKNLNGYQRVSDLVDGDAYYWSSVDPETHPGYLKKLTAMGALIHADDGIWIAPAAPGYDSRLLGGETVVERKNGETLKTEMNAAIQSKPDAIGIISWNEFSENSHIEPSLNYGDRSLKVLTNNWRSESTPIPVSDFDSSIPGNSLQDLNASRIVAIGLLVTLIFVSLLVIVRRNWTIS